MMPPGKSRYDPGWRRKDLAILILLCGVAGGTMLAGSLDRRGGAGPTTRVDDRRVRAARESIDPNTASAASLRRLPGIGPAKTQAIVEYRTHCPPPAFPSPKDLAKVTGIASTTIERIRPYLPTPPSR